MNAIRHGFPQDVDIRKFPYGDFQALDNKGMDSLPRDDYQLIKYLSKRIIKEGLWEFLDIDDRMQKRTLRSLHRLSHSVKKKDGNCLLSFFVSYVVSRKKQISTSIVENTLTPEIKDAPVNINYDTILFNSKNLVRQCVFSIEHKTRDAEPFYPCQNCRGTGRIKCPDCDGTGREQYEEGYYASGVERIRTVACPECRGTGQISCPDCEGTGKVEIFAPDYSIQKSVEEEINPVLETYYFLPGDSICRHRDEYREYQIIDWVYRTGESALLKTNINTVAEDNSKAIAEELGNAGFGSQYQEMLKWLRIPRKDENLASIDVAERKEVHCIFPVRIVEFAYGRSHGRFVLFEKDGKTHITLDSIEMMAAPERLFWRIVAIFKR